MSISKKLNILFTVLGCIVLFIVFSNLTNLSNIKSKMNDALDVHVVQMTLLEEIRFHVMGQGLYSRAAILNPAGDDLDTFITHRQDLDTDITAFSASDLTPELQAIQQQLQDANNAFNETANQFQQFVQQRQSAAAEKIVNSALKETNVTLLKLSEEALILQQKEIDVIKEESAKAIQISFISSIVLFIISISLSIGAALYVSRTVTRPLRHIVSQTELIAAGDLTIPSINVTSQDELGQLAHAFNNMKEHLYDLITRTQNATEELNASAQELSANTQEMTASAEESKSKIDATAENAQTAALVASESAIAMEETAIAVQRIAKATYSLLHTSTNTSNAAQSGIVSIEQAKQQISMISDSTIALNDLVQKLTEQSDEIGQMTKVITDITDQTNLLALNASIEAARAGEYGKGFAVVADEVRKLAEQSKNSAQSITVLTHDIQAHTASVEHALNMSIHHVKDGVDIMNVAEQSFLRITGSVQEMSKQIEDISSSSEEVSAGAEQVNASVKEIASLAQEASGHTNILASSVNEQTIATAQVNDIAFQLAENAQSLEQEIKGFKV
ncbi:MAG: methyl-accepting chemotaxis protein [Caryophanon sp.]|nr:methyl-accepting chemotaxis protein [Caryophanon sp.]